MKKTLLALTLAATALTGVKANVTPNDGDIFLGIRDTAGSFTYVLDLGSFDAFYNAHLAGPGTSINFNQSLGFTAATLASDLSATVGNNWYSSPTVVYGLFGGFNAGSFDSTISGLPDNALLIGRPTSQKFGNIADSYANALGTVAANLNANPGSPGVGQTGVTIASAWLSGNSSSGSWASYQYGTAANANNNQGISTWSIFSGPLETSVSNQIYVNTVFSLDGSANGGLIGTNIGTVSITSGGDLTFNTNAVPEPSTYVLFGLGALLLIMAYRRANA